MRQLGETCHELLRQHAVIIVLVFFAFMMRLFLAPWPSYWHDEYLSVLHYGEANSTVFDAIGTLAKRSVHPPLYQFILFFWTKIFGDTEVATRTLSNLYVAGATLCLYVVSFKVYGRRVAIGVAIIFSLMFVPIKFSVESRSYAQSLFLVSLSSLTLFYYLTRLPQGATWRDVLNTRFFCLVLVNLALLLTHYYNAFFLGAQGLFVLIYFFARNARLGVVDGFAKVAVVTVTPIILQLLIWGPVMARMYQRFDTHPRYSTKDPSLSPWAIFMQFVIQPNFGGLSRAFVIVLFALGLWFAIEAYRRRAKGINDRTLFTLYFFIWAAVPSLLAYGVFLIAHFERYSTRYFIFSAPALAILLMLAIERVVALVNRGARLTPLRPAHHYVRYAMIYAMLAALLIVVPGGMRAASDAKTDYKGIAGNVLATIRSDGDHSYILYEANWGPTLNYYLSRFDGNVRVRGTFSPRDDKRGTLSFENDQEELSRYDYLIVAFTHRRTKDYPNALKRLKELYPIHFKQLDRKGRGIIVYRIGAAPPQARD